MSSEAYNRYSETAAADNATTYFSLLDRVAKGHFAEAKTDKELYEKFLEVLQTDGHMDAETLSTFKLSLSMRSAAPRIEAHYQYYSTAIEESLTEENQDGCENWLLYNAKQFCTPNLEDAPRGAIETRAQERTLPFDRKYGTAHQNIILYADITSPSFGKFHETAMGLVRDGKAAYRLRHKRSPGQPEEALSVSGYGVSLALKRTDYIVIDDRDVDAGKVAADESQKVIKSDVILDNEEEITDIKPLEKSELSSLGMKAASYIMQSDSPFETLLKLTQDFPKYSTSLGSHNVSKEFEAEHTTNRQLLVPPGTNVLWMNGVQLIDRQIQPYGLVDLLKRERKLINGVLDLGLTGQEAVSLLGHSEVAEAKSVDEEARRFDWRDELEDGRVIIWLNNIEKDKRYADFSPSVWSLIQHFGGGMPRIRKDIFNLVVPLDLSKLEDVQFVVKDLLGFVKRLIPVRFGIVPLTTSGESIEQAKVVYHLLENYGLDAMTVYLEQSIETGKTEKPDEDIFNAAIQDRPLLEEATPLPFKDIFISEEHEKQIHLAKHWTDRLNANGEVPLAFFDGFAITRDENWMRSMNQKIGLDLQAVQQAVYYGQIDETTPWVPELFLKNAIARRNTLIYPEDAKDLTILNVNKIYTEHQDLFSKVPVIEADKESTKEDWAALTVVADLDSVDGLKLLYFAIQFRRENPGVRVDIVDNSLSPSLVNQRLKAQEDSLVTVERLVDLETILEEGKPEEDASFDAALASFLVSINQQSGSNVLILNGRLVGPIDIAEQFKPADFAELLATERAQRILPVYKAIDSLKLGDKVSGPLAAAKLTSATALSGISDLPQGIFDSAPSIRTTVYDEWKSEHISFEIGDASTANIFLVGVINPASEVGQKWAPILKVLSELEGVHVRIFLNPVEELSELPVKRFYRYVLESAPSFDESGKVKSLSAKFSGVPSETLLIAGMDVPPAWLVTSKVSVEDLDNLRIKDIKARRGTDQVEAVYELENILIEGHSRELPAGSPPRGVQLVLATDSDPHFADTIIMANLGFFQFKANPGVYHIQLKEGRSSDIFNIQSVGAKGWAAVPGDETTEIALMDFQGTTLYPRLVRKPGMEEEDVLEDTFSKSKEDAGASDSILSKGIKFAEGLFGKGKDAVATTPSVSDTEHAEINIFSVASGHLYERMLNIMMVSVMRHTKHTVKFWFIEQFLSPSFKDFIPVLAEQYGFKYEMVTYKWPHWLRQQKEKQREIWGYKILFLDVLFPLSLDKVIFVDADQIVRTDMYDLVQLDLEGAPYGFTPMCDSRTEMEGFRFWKTGYWNNYLKGQPYHISALYVVDLRRFRELAAGDRLRQQYHALSADPNSLANLDQDLPNHMQFQIPIHSLPQDWLWCETWCSDETLKTAKTIDLCNNPQTKEPKLDRARRQVPEWTEYDEEIAELAKKARDAPPRPKVTATKKNTKSRTLDTVKGTGMPAGFNRQHGHLHDHHGERDEL